MFGVLYTFFSFTAGGATVHFEASVTALPWRPGARPVDGNCGT
jgi:hypothetical protein